MILVIDGQGGGIGRALTESLRSALPSAEIIAVGTNAGATSAMLRAGATAGATGENAVKYNARHAEIIAGPVGILSADAMYGEISPAIAAAVSGSSAVKVLIPISKSNIMIAGTQSKLMAQYIEETVHTIVTLVTQA